MFLEPLLRRNRSFVNAAVQLHRSGALPANSFVLDLDAVRHNAALLRAEADRLGLELFAMTKQVGRNPAFLRALRDVGVGTCVAVDMACARIVHREGMAVGHLGHLVQIPAAEAGAAARMEPANWTVFSQDKAYEAAFAAAAIGREQSLLARIHAPQDTFYNGHEGGFAADDVERVAEMLDGLEGGRFAGITTFPALLYDPEAQQVKPTPNLSTLAAAAARLGPGMRVNAPGTTSVEVLSLLADHGATQVEPGHALTGTTPLHAVHDLPEVPAALYLSEVSHIHDGRAYFFGGGTYVDPVFPPYQVRAFVGEQLVDAELPPPAAIDYYGQLRPTGSARPVTGDTVVLGFRIQAFVTRAYVAGIDGVESDQPRVAGVWTAAGDPAQWPL
jgi:predicted amino acid racemase